MKDQPKNIRPVRNWHQCLFVIIISSFLMMSISFVTTAESSQKMTLLSLTADSLTLVYNSIEASNFPHIVSLVTVTNDAGFIVGRLDTNNFEVHEDGVRERPIQVVELSDADIGINVVLAIDRSGSMRGQPIEDAKSAAATFVQLMQKKDKSAVVSFSHFPQTDYPFTGDMDSLKDAIFKIDAKGGTAIFDALLHSVYLMNAQLKNRAIILLTDGADKDSRYSYQEALTACLSYEVRVFCIGLGLNRNSPEENILKELASKTGGLYYYSPTSNDLLEIYKAISQLLHHRYQISYTTHNPAKDGTLRHVRIDVIVQHNTAADTASYRAPYEEPAPAPPVPSPDLPPIVEEVFEVIPNPFTPNDDGFNDRTEFRQGNGIPASWLILIMDRTGHIIKRMSKGERFWNGKDETGQLMMPGSYLYMVLNGNQLLHRGLVQLIR